MMQRKVSLTVSLELHQLRDEEVRRGWVRIHEDMRAGIPAEDLVYLEGPTGGVFRVVLGLPDGYRVGERVAQPNWVCMDEPTRNAIGLKDHAVGSRVTLTIGRRAQPLRTVDWLRYSLSHPEIPLKIGSWLALILGVTSLILGAISVWLGVLSVK
jgi:hypothetical protein